MEPKLKVAVVASAPLEAKDIISALLNMTPTSISGIEGRNEKVSWSLDVFDGEVCAEDINSVIRSFLRREDPTIRLMTERCQTAIVLALEAEEQEVCSETFLANETLDLISELNLNLRIILSCGPEFEVGSKPHTT
jgi:hypothetical protein